MVNLVVGLFKNKKDANEAIMELKASQYSEDISLIAKDTKTKEIYAHQVKEMPGEEEMPGANKGLEIGFVGGVVIGLFMILNPAVSSLGVLGALCAAFGVTGATIGTLTGAYLGSLNKAGLPPERAKLYKNKIKSGEIFVSVLTPNEGRKELKSIFAKHGASHIHSLINVAQLRAHNLTKVSRKALTLHKSYN